jgi:hypothetical protein
MLVPCDRLKDAFLPFHHGRTLSDTVFTGPAGYTNQELTQMPFRQLLYIADIREDCTEHS